MAKFDLKKAILENKATFFSSLTEGQFSWMTQDTNQQIGSQDENQIPVYMFDNKGKFYYENDYDGYGVFGGKDYYELVAEMNGYTMFNDLRGIGIKLAFDELETKNENGDVLFPALITRPNFNWKSHDFTKEAETDPNQSWYEPEKEDEDTKYPNAYTDDVFNHNSEIGPGDNEDDDYGSDNDDYEEDDMMEGLNEAKMYYHVLEDGGYGRIGHQGYYNTPEEAKKRADELSDMFPKSEFYVEAYPSKKEPVTVTMEENKEVKSNTKMKKSELKDKIKEMILKEMESNNMEDAPENEVDFLAEIEEMLDEEEEFLVTLLVPTVYFNPETGELAETPAAFGADSELEDMDITNYSDGDELSEWVFDNDIEKAKYFEKEYPGLFKVEGAMNEAKDEEVADEEVEVTDDFSTEEPQGPGGIDVTQNADADLTGTKKEVQDNLEAALEAARTLGDEKLATQVGNTITFFNKQHVVKDTTVAENIKETLLLQKRAGIITETQYKQKLNEISEFENLEQDILDFWGVQQDDAAQSDGEYEAKWDNKFFIDEYPKHEGKEQEINSIVKKYKI